MLKIVYFIVGTDSRSNETILQELSEKHQQKLADEKSKFQDLTSILDDYKVNLNMKINALFHLIIL